jgi:DNA-directed RNA polymerase subunit alpha
MVMRARWRSFELPTRVEVGRDTLTAEYGKFVAEPFEHGFGTTIGNSIRRVLLSSIEGAAVTHVKIEGALHEFSSLDGVLEDVTHIVLNIKRMRVRMDSEVPQTLTLDVCRKGEIYAGDFDGGAFAEVFNKDHVICTCTEEVPLRMELTVARGRGYRTAEENDIEDREIGVIPIDSSFSPVQRVRFRTENTRVGQLTDYDKLILEVWTDGTVDPEHAVVQAGKILRKHLIPFVNYFELGDELAAAAANLQASIVTGAMGGGAGGGDLGKAVADMGFSTRTHSALLSGGIATIGDLINCSEDDLLGLANFGKVALTEVKEHLETMGLALAEGAAAS